MPALQVVHANPSTLTTVIGQVKDAFEAMGNATPILIGKKYLDDFGVGSAPRVLFVPEAGGGKVGPPIEMGNAASVIHSCNVFVRAEESGDDVGRFDRAYALGDLVIDCIHTAAPGRVEFGSFEDDSPTDADAYGADLAFSFLYARDVRHDTARWSLPAADDDTSAVQPAIPPGQPGTVDSVDVTVDPVEGP